MRRKHKLSKYRQYSRQFLEVSDAFTVESMTDEEREEFSYQMTRRYMANQFKRVRQNSKRFDEPFTQRKLSGISEVHETWISSFEGGRIANPQLKTLTHMAHSLGCCLEVRLVPYSYFLKLNADYDKRGKHPLSTVFSLDEEALQRKRATGEIPIYYQPPNLSQG